MPEANESEKRLRLDGLGQSNLHRTGIQPFLSVAVVYPQGNVL